MGGRGRKEQLGKQLLGQARELWAPIQAKGEQRLLFWKEQDRSEALRNAGPGQTLVAKLELTSRKLLERTNYRIGVKEAYDCDCRLTSG